MWQTVPISRGQAETIVPGPTNKSSFILYHTGSDHRPGSMTNHILNALQDYNYDLSAFDFFEEFACVYRNY